MADKAPPVTSAKDALERADKIMPTVKATEETRISEMQKLIDQVENSIDSVGPFARVFGQKGDHTRFAVLREPVEFKSQQGRKVKDIGLVIVTSEGFKGYVVEETGQSYLKDSSTSNLRKFPDEIGRGGYKVKYTSKDIDQKGPCLTESGQGYLKRYPLVDIEGESLALNAIEQSILKAQEKPRQTMARDNQTIGIASGAQVSIAQATLKK